MTYIEYSGTLIACVCKGTLILVVHVHTHAHSHSHTHTHTHTHIQLNIFPNWKSEYYAWMKGSSGHTPLMSICWHVYMILFAVGLISHVKDHVQVPFALVDACVLALTYQLQSLKQHWLFKPPEWIMLWYKMITCYPTIQTCNLFYQAVTQWIPAVI